VAQIITRYGYAEKVSDPFNEWVTRRLLSDLRIEQFDEPDNEHTQVSVGNEHWSVTVEVSGLVTFDNLDRLEGVDSTLPETMYLRDIPDETLIAIWQAVVREDQQAILSYPWCSQDDLPRYARDYYRQESVTVKRERRKGKKSD
jgi:hypothetical protein